MKRMTTAATAASSLVLITATSVFAQEQTQDNVEVLSAWAYDALYAEGWSVESMFNETEVVNIEGEVIGDVENIMFSNDGKVLGLIAEIGGVLDVGDTHISVPWDEVTVAKGIGELTVLVTETNIGDYDVFGDYWGSEELVTAADMTGSAEPVNDDITTGPSIFKATDLIGDYVFLSDNVRYGYISDLIVQDGAIAAIVTDASAYGRNGYYAYPYPGAVTPMGSARYDLPYNSVEIDTIDAFDYEQLKSNAAE